MPKYKIKRWSAVDVDGNRKQAGETIELSEDDAEFYGDRLEKVEKDPESDNDFDALPDDTEFPYHYGSGWYFLSNGDKVRGEENAIEAQEELNEQSNSG